MMMKVTIVSNKQKQNPAICVGNLLSILSMSDENLFNTLPEGLASKKFTGHLITDISKVSCRYLAKEAHFQ